MFLIVSTYTLRIFSLINYMISHQHRGKDMGVFVSCSFICCFPPIPTLFANFAPVSGEADLSTSYPRYMGIFLCTYLWRGYICLSSFPITISTLHVSHSIAGTCDIQLHQLPLEWSLVLRLKLGKIGSDLESGRYKRAVRKYTGRVQRNRCGHLCIHTCIPTLRFF